MLLIQIARDCNAAHILCMAGISISMVSAALTPFEHPRACKGFAKEEGTCPDLPPCKSVTCKPINCQLSDWDDWIESGGCTGLCERHRSVLTSNNECGSPCSGALVGSKPCFKDSCQVKPKNCKLTEWSSWSVCGSLTQQKQRTRQVASPPVAGGKPCDGVLIETMPCGQPRNKVDCKFSEWGEWTECSATCGAGFGAQMRRIVNHARYGGKLCAGSIHRTRECSSKPCNHGQPCILGNWSEWAGCDSVSPLQKYRKREVKQPSQNGGAACNDVIKETAGCPVNEPAVPCKISAWSEWDTCKVTCDGGQTFRKRVLLSPAVNGGTCDAGMLHETKPCGMQPCNPPGQKDCVLESWGKWSACSTKCGQGVKTRTRKVKVPGAVGAKGCEGALSEAAACEMNECGKTDCEWDTWADWSSCTCTCGGGTKRRTRVVKVAPRNGGDLCSAEDKAEIQPCNIESCEFCMDGLWMDWSDWSSCSATCGAGFSSRHRDVAIHPNSCGKPVSGLEDEYKACAASVPCVPDRDCQLSTWSSWSECSCTCFGIRERDRTVLQYASGKGKACIEDALKEITQCNPGIGEKVPPECGIPTPRACQLADWSSWGDCSAECDGGHKTRLRQVLTPAATDGVPCSGSLSEVVACNTKPCEIRKCLDCLWSDWSAWGECAKCGDQRYRHRSIRQMPNFCGKKCTPEAAKEVGQCKSTCEQTVYCSWTDWSAYGGCSGQCGPATNLRQRKLAIFKEKPADILFEGSPAMVCGGAQLQQTACKYVSCSPEQPPVDCVLGAWSAWTAPTCTQLCERTRQISTVNANGGKPCAGALVETKRCLHNCTTPVDCTMSAWDSWSACQDGVAQSYRSRSILHMKANGGSPCTGLLKETAPCKGSVAESNDCVFSSWMEWGPCSQTCGGGLHSRSRSIQKLAVGGLPCSGSLAESDGCNVGKCPDASAPCQVGAWTEWGDCTSSLQKFRERKIISEGSNGGKPCEMPLKEVTDCQVIVDCRVSAWTAWDACDKTCGGGQQQRHREVMQAPHGGVPCPPDLVMTQGCNPQVCGKMDCQVSEWSQWSACPVDCGTGQQQRARTITQEPAAGGEGCKEALTELRPCQNAAGNGLPACSTIDCLWSDWSDWSSCTCSCDGGQRTRDRHIQRIPQKGGAPCQPKSKEEIEPCNTQKCSGMVCKDGKWADWSEWKPCSQTCKGGLTWRSRKVEEQANSCGKPAVGPSRVYASCNQDVSCEPNVDCQLSEWGAWSDCTKDCNGIKRRSRRITVHGKGQGKFCIGDLKQTGPCNPSEGEGVPPGCQKQPPPSCSLSTWQEWTSCTASCGGGQQSRSRILGGDGRHGGPQCVGALSEMQGCNTQLCQAECTPVDCQWGDWGEWSGCDKCGGEKKRSRHVKVFPSCNGKPCEAGVAEEATNCTRKCHEPTYCALADWKEWSQCSTSCGKGTRSRLRSLELVSAPESVRVLVGESGETEGLFSEKFEQLEQMENDIQTRRLQEMVVAFACGLMSLVVGLLFVRAVHRSRNSAYSEISSRQTAVNVAVE